MNGDDYEDGIDISGTVMLGASSVILTGFASGVDVVNVNLGGAVQNNVAVNADGSWTSLFAAGEFTPARKPWP